MDLKLLSPPLPENVGNDRDQTLALFPVLFGTADC